MKTNTLFVFNAEANNKKKRVNNNTLFVNDAEANNNNKKSGLHGAFGSWGW